MLAHSAIKAAAVTSLGMGGTNVHIILTAPPLVRHPSGAVRSAPVRPGDQAYELILSARTEADLREMAGDLCRYLGAADIRIDDLAYTLGHGRARAAKSVVIRARTLQDARDELLRFVDGHPVATGEAQARPPDLSGAVKVPIPATRCIRSAIGLTRRNGRSSQSPTRAPTPAISSPRWLESSAAI